MREDQQFIAYSLPGSSEYLLGTIRAIDRLDSKSDIQQYDFVLAPFDKKNQPGYLIKFSSISGGRKFHCSPQVTSVEKSTSRDQYGIGFKEIIKNIQDKKVEKVVLARQLLISKDSIDVYEIFIALKNKYPNAFTYVLHAQQTGTWIGASPEVVLEQSENQLITKAIAGTKSIDSKMPWTQKEILEHKFIETFYKKVLNENNIEFSQSESSTIPAGNISHICSELKLSASYNKIQLAELIHPSPALSGYPKLQQWT